MNHESLIEAARSLRSEGAENLEYDRALVEFCCLLLFGEIDGYRAGMEDLILGSPAEAATRGELLLSSLFE